MVADTQPATHQYPLDQRTRHIETLSWIEMIETSVWYDATKQKKKKKEHNNIQLSSQREYYG
jgi:hypothetical protein